MSDAGKIPLQILDLEPEGGTGRALGEAELAAEGRLNLLRADAVYREWLETVLGKVNGLKELSVRIPPPPEAPRYCLYVRPVRRDDPDFFPALRDYLRTYYGILLIPGEASGAPPS